MQRTEEKIDHEQVFLRMRRARITMTLMAAILHKSVPTISRSLRGEKSHVRILASIERVTRRYEKRAAERAAKSAA